MPTYPIYVPLLPPEAQRVIGKVHDSSIPAMKNLAAEGFTFSGMVDIFDAGACVSCPRDEVRTIRQSRTAVVGQITSEKIDSPTHMIGRFAPTFAATIGPMRTIDADRICVETQVAAALGISTGSKVRYAPLRSAADLAAAHGSTGLAGAGTAGSIRSSKSVPNDSD